MVQRFTDTSRWQKQFRQDRLDAIDWGRTNRMVYIQKRQIGWGTFWGDRLDGAHSEGADLPVRWSTFQKGRSMVFIQKGQIGWSKFRGDRSDGVYFEGTDWMEHILRGQIGWGIFWGDRLDGAHSEGTDQMGTFWGDRLDGAHSEGTHRMGTFRGNRLDQVHQGDKSDGAVLKWTDLIEYTLWTRHSYYFPWDLQPAGKQSLLRSVNWPGGYI